MIGQGSCVESFAPRIDGRRLTPSESLTSVMSLGVSRNTVRAALVAEGPPRYVRKPAHTPDLKDVNGSEADGASSLSMTIRMTRDMSELGRQRPWQLVLKSRDHMAYTRATRYSGRYAVTLSRSLPGNLAKPLARIGLGVASAVAPDLCCAVQNPMRAVHTTREESRELSEREH